MSIYRVRRSWLGKLILQHRWDGDWEDAPSATEAAFFAVPPIEWNALQDRIAKYEKRADAQRKARADRKAKVTVENAP